MRPVSLTMPLPMNKTDASTSGPAARFLLAGPLPPPGTRPIADVRDVVRRASRPRLRLPDRKHPRKEPLLPWTVVPAALNRNAAFSCPLRERGDLALPPRVHYGFQIQTGLHARHGNDLYRPATRLPRRHPCSWGELRCFLPLAAAVLAVPDPPYSAAHSTDPRPQRAIARHVRLRPDAPRSASRVVANSLFFTPNAAPRGRRLRPDRPIRLLFLSNLIQSKGYVEVLEAVAILRRTTAIPLKAVFAGPLPGVPRRSCANAAEGGGNEIP